MTTTGNHLRGHPIEWDCSRLQWIYSDTREATASTWRDRPCGYCDKHSTHEGHDACLGTLPGVMNACCGHGHTSEAYVQYWGGDVVSGPAAASAFDRLIRQRGDA